MDVPAGVTQKEGHTGFLIHLLSAVHALIFLARRIQPFLSLVDREVEFCVLTILIVLHPLGIFIFVFSFLVRKTPFAGIELTSQCVRGLRGTSELPGRPAAHTRTKTYRNQHTHIISRTHRMFRYNVRMLIFRRKRTEIFFWEQALKGNLLCN